MSSSDSEYEPSPEPGSSPSAPNEREKESLKGMGVFSGVFENNELSDTDSGDSPLEEMNQGESSLSDGDDLEDPEWLPAKGNKKGTDRSKSKPSKLHSEFEMFRKIEYELFQEEPSFSSHLEERYDARIANLTDSQVLSDEANDSDSEEGDMCAGEIAEQATKFFSELYLTARSQRKNLKGFEGNFINRKAQRLPSHLEPVMGSANLAIAQKKYTDAIELCNEVIRQAPCCSAPYINLALTYKELEDMDRYFQFTLLALHINSFDRSHPRPEDAESWEQLGVIAKQRGDLSMAIECIKKSLYAIPKRPEALWLLGEIRLELKEYRAALATYSRLEKIVQETGTPLELCEIARRKALILYESGSVEQAREVIYQHLIKGWETSHVIELFNLLLELHLIDKEYTTALKSTVILLCCKTSQLISNELNPVVVVVEEFSEQVMSISNEGVLSSEEARAGDKKESKLQLFERYFWNDVTRDPGFEVESEGGFLVVIEEKQILIPEHAFALLPLDLQAKVVIPSIHTSNLELAHHLITHALKSLPIAGYGEIWLDVSEALLECSQFDLSVDLLRTVLQCGAYDEPGVWLMLGRSLEEVSYQEELWEDWNDKPILDEAMGLYRKVIDTIPGNVDSKLRLAGIYQKKGMKEEAIALLSGSQDGTDNFLSNKDIINPKQPPDVRVVYRRAILHMENGQREECLSGFLTLLDYFCREVYLLKSFHLMEMPFITTGSRYLQRYKTEMVYSRYQQEEEEQDQYLTMSQWYSVLKSTCDMLSALGKREELFKLIIAVNILKKFRDTEFILDVHLLSVSVCIRQRSFYYAYRFSRRLTHLISKSNVFAMLFNCLTENSYLSRNMSLKVLKRIWLQDPTNYRIVLNFALTLNSIGSFHLSLLLLHSAYKLRPDNYRLLFFMTMTYIRLAHNRTHASKNALISQAFAFAFKYKEKMGDCPEVLYNLGRAFHAIGYKHWACDYYRRVLALDISSDLRRAGQCFDAELVELSSLKREAAFNLSLIYEESGSRELARAMLQSHCVV